MNDAFDDSARTPLYAHDFYGAPAWTFWLLCIATGIICGIVLVVV